jgi:hypothetical protein
VTTLRRVANSCSVDKGDSSLDSRSGEPESVLIFLFGGSIVVVVLGLDGRRSLSDGRSSNPRVPSSKGVVIRAQWIWHGTNFCFTTAMLSLVNFIVL